MATMMNPLAYVLLPTLAAGAAYLLSPLAGRLAVSCGAVDMPGERKIHQKPMPRLGGLAVLAATAFAVSVVAVGERTVTLPWPLLRGLLAGLMPTLVVSVIDDVRPVSARIKFVCHLAGATVAVWSGISLPAQVHLLGHQFAIGFLAAPLSVVWLAGVTNAFNIIDGLDGLAAGLAFISAVAMSAVFLVLGQYGSALVPLALAGALAGFLPYNLYPARMFLGDTGATAVGFCLAALALRGGATISAGFAAALPILLMGLPIADTLIAICRRLVRKAERSVGGVFQPDRNHVHHRLLALGLDHRRAVFVLYGLGALTAAVALVSLFITSREAALLLFALVTAGFIGVKRLGYDEFALLRRGTILRLYDAPVLRRSLFVAFVDMAFVAVSVYLANGLRTDDWLLRTSRSLVFELALFLAPFSVIVYWKARLYEGSWRLATIDDYTRACGACVIAAGLALMLISWQLQAAPASLLVIYGLVNSMFVVGSRASYRILVNARQRTGRGGTPVLLYGPGPEDLVAARDMIDGAIASGFRPVGLLSPYRGFKGNFVDGVKVWGSVDEFPQIVRRAGAEAVLIGQRAGTDELVERLSVLCQHAHIALCRLQVTLESLATDPVPAAAEEMRGSSENRDTSTGFPCPSCGAAKLRRSHARGVEQLRKRLTTKRVFRCEACRWRGWRQPIELNLQCYPSLTPGVDLSLLDVAGVYQSSIRQPLPGESQIGDLHPRA